MSGLVVCVGDLVEDVVVWPAAPTRVGTDSPARITRSRGGSAANVAAFAAHRGPTRFLGRVGPDPVGDTLVAELTGHGIDVRVQRGGHTGTVVIRIEPDRTSRSTPSPGCPDPAATTAAGPPGPRRIR